MVFPHEAIGAPRILSKKAFAELIGVTPGRVTQYISNGMPTVPGATERSAKIDVAAAKLWIKGHVSPTRSAAQSSQSELPFAAQKDAAEERVRLLKEQADHAALKNQQLRRELVPASDVEREWAGVLRLIRSRILAVPSRVRQVLPHLDADDIAAIDAELKSALEGLSHGQ